MTMNVSIVANVINVAGNCVGVFILHLGAAGVAWPSLLSRMLSAAAVTAYCFRKQNPVRYRRAAGDVKFAMVVSISLTIGARLLDMLHGSIWDKIPRFALPVAATAILE